MMAFLSWYLSVSIFGWLTFPLVYAVFPALEDRGYSLVRAAGLLVWGYIFWLLASLGIAQNDTGGLVLAALFLAGLSVWVARNRWGEILSWIKQHVSMLITVEIIFLLAFAILALIRAANPEIQGTEKPMELAFINSILRSPTFPPRDPWLSGYGISYYYFGYVMTAMLARLSGVQGSVAFNLMLALVYALSAVGSYGIIYNLLAGMQKKGSATPQKAITVLPILGPLFLLITSNLEGFLEVLHRKGLFWKFAADGTATSAFWKWLDIKDLSQAPLQPFSWLPERYLWWWRASRVVSDTTLQNASQELIDEFPVFSYILGDLHPHVLALPFGLLAVGVGLNLFLGGWRGQTRIFGFSLPIQWQGMFVPMVVLGGLAFLNTWDILIAAAIVCAAFLLHRTVEAGWGWRRIEEILGYVLIVGVGSLLLYVPFYIGFSSQAGGILPNLVNPTRGAHLWVMFGGLLFPIFAYLAYLVFNQKMKADWSKALLAVVGLIFGLWSLTWLGSWLIYTAKPEVADAFFQNQGVPNLATLFQLASQRRLAYIGGLLTMSAILAAGAALLFGSLNAMKKEPFASEEDDPAVIVRAGTVIDPIPFVLMLALFGGLLVLVPDFVFLRDQFGWRINTIFKFYYQTWMLWSLVAALGTAILLMNLRGTWDWLFRLGLSIVLIMSLTYTVLAVMTKTNQFKPEPGWSLDGAAYLQRYNPDEAMAVEWLKQSQDGIVVEAVGGSYSNYARISTLTGLPTVLGWPGHEGQWRGSSTPQGDRQEDVKRLYETSSWQDAKIILEKYEIRYIYIGSLERSTYQVNEAKFLRYLIPIFSQGGVTIYPAP
jgi:YYY domain-containing protein